MQDVAPLGRETFGLGQRSWIATTDDHFPLPDITLRERGTPAEQYRQAVAQRKGSADGA